MSISNGLEISYWTTISADTLYSLSTKTENLCRIKSANGNSYDEAKQKTRYSVEVHEKVEGRTLLVFRCLQLFDELFFIFTETQFLVVPQSFLSFLFQKKKKNQKYEELSIVSGIATTFVATSKLSACRP
ncbi:hypothetical protein AVEN_1384-1 [Araneus ventricosus]|uniref:Uncharacterized protein n=1 Tax=Araneus ventricosus TaxID=182803 RepID=A0A4Y2KQX1_ARAVE|nr:hypothetical protein AVEN_1384-1 [Araneus ventricosus]